MDLLSDPVGYKGNRLNVVQTIPPLPVVGLRDQDLVGRIRIPDIDLLTHLAGIRGLETVRGRMYLLELSWGHGKFARLMFSHGPLNLS